MLVQHALLLAEHPRDLLPVLDALRTAGHRRRDRNVQDPLRAAPGSLASPRLAPLPVDRAGPRLAGLDGLVRELKMAYREEQHPVSAVETTSPEEHPGRWRPMVGRLVVGLCVALAIALVILVLHHLDVRPRTTDAIVTANTIRVVPEVTGRIEALNVKDDAVVHRGDVLYTIEQERFALNLAQARAQVRALEAEIDLTNRRVSSQVTAVSVTRAQAEAVRARLQQATDTLARMEPLLPDGYVTPEQVEKARTARSAAESELRAALSTTRQTEQVVGDSKALQAQFEGARALVGLAERDLRNTVVRAPFDGRVVGVKTSVGEMVSPARALFTLIDTSQWFIIADFRETELERIREGER